MSFFDSFPIYLLFEIMALLTALFQYNKIKRTVYKDFLPYLVCVVIYEKCSLYNLFSIRHSNLWITNITIALSFLFLSTFLCKIIKTASFKKWIKLAIYFSITCSAINMAFVQGFWKLDSITILLEYAIIITINFLYFYELMNYSGEPLNIIKLPGFWLNTGLLFFYLLQFLTFASFAYMAYKGSYDYLLLFSVISYSANVILYSCITVALLCPQQTKT